MSAHVRPLSPRAKGRGCAVEAGLDESVFAKQLDEGVPVPVVRDAAQLEQGVGLSPEMVPPTSDARQSESSHIFFVPSGRHA